MSTDNRSQMDAVNLARLERLVADSMINERDPYLASIEGGRFYHLGSAVPVVGDGYVQRVTGAWTPRSAGFGPVPLDYAKTYIQLSEVTGGHRIGMAELEELLRRTEIRDALMPLVAIMGASRNVGENDPIRRIDELSLDFFSEPYRTRLSLAFKRGSVLHASQLVMVMIKLALLHCPDRVDPSSRKPFPFSLALLGLADNLDVESINGAMPDASQLTLELAANQRFNSSIRVDSLLTSFQRRWIEMPGASPASFEDAFHRSTGVKLFDQSLAGFSLYTRATQYGPLVDHKSYFSAVGWSAEYAANVVNLFALPLDDYRARIKQEFDQHRLDWYFTTFARYPVIDLGGELLIVDPDLLLRRCFGDLPMFDVEEGLRRQEGNRGVTKIRAAFTDCAERYVRESFQSITADNSHGARVYGDRQLKRAFAGAKVADVTVDYGDAWVVVEVTTTPVARDTVNAARLEGLEKDRKTVITEAEQIGSTIRQLKKSEQVLTGYMPKLHRKFYPLVVMTDGFPSNPLTITAIREELKEKNILQGGNIAPLEVVDLTEIDMIEGVSETGGFTLPQILEMKQSSPFRADSIRNFLVADSRFDPRRPRRVGKGFRTFLNSLGKAFEDSFEISDDED